MKELNKATTTSNYRDKSFERALRHVSMVYGWDRKYWYSGRFFQVSKLWYRIVGEYPYCHIGEPEDKLIALSAVAQRIELVMRLALSIWPAFGNKFLN